MRCLRTGLHCECDYRTPQCVPRVPGIKSCWPAMESNVGVTERHETVQASRADADRGLRYNEGKLRLDLLPPDTIADLAQLLTIGAKKYAERNWEKGMPYKDAIGSLMRHLFKWIGGEDCDEETGMSHMVHVMCNAMFLATWQSRKVGTDDRVNVGWKKP